MRCIIIEDEIPAQIVLKSYLKKVPDLELIDTFQTAKQAHEFFKTNNADIVFLDINLPDILGIDFIKTVAHPPKIIMTTAYPDYALDSFELDTIVDYLVKPFSFDRFLKAIHKVQSQFSTKENVEDSIYLNVDKTLHRIKLEDILFLESDRNYITVFTETQKFSTIDTLKTWNSKLEKNTFLQVHKSFIINLKKIDKISGNEVFIAKKRIPIGRTFKQEFLQKVL